MREIKFRGLRTDGKGWVYGYLTIDNLGKCIIRWFNGDAHNIPFACEVIPESVGQFTGLKDSSGNDMYEGDLILLRADSESKELGKANGSWNTECFFNKSKVCLNLRCIDRPNLIWSFNDLDFNGFTFKKQITGNIHENN